MHGISHLYRQHAVEKQISVGSAGVGASSTDSWSQQNSVKSSYEPSSLQGHTLYSMESSSNSSSSNSNNSNNSTLGGVTGSAFGQWQTERHSQPQAVPDAHKSLANHHYNNSPFQKTSGGEQSGQRSSYDSCYTSGSGISGSLKRTPSSKRSFFERSHSPAIYGVSSDKPVVFDPVWTAAFEIALYLDQLLNVCHRITQNLSSPSLGVSRFTD